MANGKRTPPPSGRRIAQLLSHVRPAAAEQSVVDRLDGAAEPDDSLYDASVAALALQDQLPVVVLDLLLPRQRVQLAVQDVAHTRMVCGCLESAAGGGAPACFGVVGRDPLSQQPLSFGVECEILHSELAGGTMQIELVGRRCFSVQGATRQSDGHSVASVGWAFAEPPEPAELAPLRASTEQLYALTEEWLSLVLATGAEQHPGHMDEVLLGLGPRPTGSAETAAADAAMWAAALINPTPSLGIAPEIRHVMLAAAVRDLPARDKIAIVNDAIIESLGVMRANAGTDTGS